MTHGFSLLGKLAAILCLAECQVCPEQANMRKPRRVAGAGVGSVSVVAGTRINLNRTTNKLQDL